MNKFELEAYPQKERLRRNAPNRHSFLPSSIWLLLMSTVLSQVAAMPVLTWSPSHVDDGYTTIASKENSDWLLCCKSVNSLNLLEPSANKDTLRLEAPDLDMQDVEELLQEPIKEDEPEKPSETSADELLNKAAKELWERMDYVLVDEDSSEEEEDASVCFFLRASAVQDLYDYGIQLDPEAKIHW
jgi:hypothetical protein